MAGRHNKLSFYKKYAEKVIDSTLVQDKRVYAKIKKIYAPKTKN